MMRTLMSITVNRTSAHKNQNRLFGRNQYSEVRLQELRMRESSFKFPGFYPLQFLTPANPETQKCSGIAEKYLLRLCYTNPTGRYRFDPCKRTTL